MPRANTGQPQNQKSLRPFFDQLQIPSTKLDAMLAELDLSKEETEHLLNTSKYHTHRALRAQLIRQQLRIIAQDNAKSAMQTLLNLTCSSNHAIARLAATQILLYADATPIHDPPLSPPPRPPVPSAGEAYESPAVTPAGPSESAPATPPETPPPQQTTENQKSKIQYHTVLAIALLSLLLNVLHWPARPPRASPWIYAGAATAQAAPEVVPLGGSAYTLGPVNGVAMKQHAMDELLALIERVWGYKELRTHQRSAMAAFVGGRDSLTVLPTGGGKSLCYQAPALYLSENGGGPTVVVSPLIALMKDQVDSLRELGVAASQMDSSLSPEDRRMAAEEMRAGRLAMLFVSPERLVGNGDFQQMLRDAGVRNFAIDEAHCISHWGHDFRPEYRKLAGLKEMFPGVRVHGFTATATERVRRDIAEQLKLEDPELLVGNFDRPNLAYRVLPRRNALEQIREILERHVGEAGIIYCPRRRDVDEITKTLAADKKLGRRVDGYHAGMSSELRKRVQNQFIQEECDLIVATVAFGMGIDRSNIRFIVHTASPKSIESYQQETGRAGRDGLEAECVLLYSGSDAISNRSLVERSASDALAEGMKIDPAFLPAVLKHIEEMDRFARGAMCRHRTLVEYFGQQYVPPANGAGGVGAAGESGCGACDICLGDTTPLADSVVVAQKILSCVARTGQRFGAAHVISILRGENTERIRSLRHDELSVHGLLSDYKPAELRDFVYQLIGQGVLAQENLVLASGHTAGILKLNGASVEVMKGKRAAKLVQIVRKSAREARKTRGEVISWEGVDAELFERLRKWRKREGERKGVPPYVVFSDAALREMAKQKPQTPAALRGVYGVGEKKLAEYGRAVLEMIAQHAGNAGGGRG